MWGQAFWPAAALPGGVALDRATSGAPASPAPYPNAQAALVSPHTRTSGRHQAKISDKRRRSQKARRLIVDAGHGIA